MDVSLCMLNGYYQWYDYESLWIISILIQPPSLLCSDASREAEIRKCNREWMVTVMVNNFNHVEWETIILNNVNNNVEWTDYNSWFLWLMASIKCCWHSPENAGRDASDQPWWETAAASGISTAWSRDSIRGPRLAWESSRWVRGHRGPDIPTSRRNDLQETPSTAPTRPHQPWEEGDCHGPWATHVTH